MMFYREHTRRSVIRACAALLSGGVVSELFATPPSALPMLFSPARRTYSSGWTYRQYAVHATVTVGSIPLISKKNVGGGAIAIERAVDGENVWTAIQLVAGSSPDRLKGFNRFGATQELIREDRGGVRESGYLSFMSTSRETGIKEARKAFSSQAGSRMSTFARGRATDQGCTYAVEHRNLADGWNWRNCTDLLAEPGFDAAGLAPERAIPGYGSCCLPTFLFAVHHALTREEVLHEGSYVHNGKVFLLQTECKAEGSGSSLRIVTGRTAQDGRHSEFRLWLDTKNKQPLPEKIEYKPRGFLSLTLEAENSFEAPTLRPLLVSPA